MCENILLNRNGMRKLSVLTLSFRMRRTVLA